MPAEIYEIVALAARFWFLFLMALIVWRSYRWYARERRQRKKRLRLLPDAGYIGEFVVMQSAGDLSEGDVLSVPFEGTLGFVRSNDLCVPVPGVSGRHLWFSYDERKGLKLTPLGRNDFSVDELTIGQKPEGLYMIHGSRLYVGECELRLRMFAGYEVGVPAVAAGYPQPGYGAGQPDPGWQEPPQGQAAYGVYGYGQPQRQPYAPQGQYTETGYVQLPTRQYPQAAYAPQSQQPFQGPQGQYVDAAYAQPRMQPYPQGVYTQPQQQYANAADMQPVEYTQPVYRSPSHQPPQPAAPTDDQLDNAYRQPHSAEVEVEPQIFHPLMDEDSWDEYEDAYEEEAEPQQETPPPARQSPAQPQQAFYPLEEGEEEWPYLPRPDEWRSEGLFDDLLDEDGTDASAPPKSAYVGRDESAWAKRRVWDRYFGGGGGQ